MKNRYIIIIISLCLIIFSLSYCLFINDVTKIVNVPIGEKDIKIACNFHGISINDVEVSEGYSGTYLSFERDGKHCYLFTVQCMDYLERIKNGRSIKFN